MLHFPSGDLGTAKLGHSGEYLGYTMYFFFDQDIKGHNVKQRCSNIWSGRSFVHIQIEKCHSVVWSPLADLENLLLSAERKYHVATSIRASWLGDQTKGRGFLMTKLTLIVFKNSLQWKSGGKLHLHKLKTPQADWLWKSLFNTCILKFKLDEARLRLEALFWTVFYSILTYSSWVYSNLQ